METGFAIQKIKVHQFPFVPIDSRMYLLIRDGAALAVDPCVSEQALALLKAGQVEKVTVVVTHGHYDHISGINWLRRNFSCNVFCTEESAEMMKDADLNLSNFSEALSFGHSEEKQCVAEKAMEADYTANADSILKQEDIVSWCGMEFRSILTPGHTPGSICLLYKDQYIFTGDTLVNGYKTVTKLPGGSKKDFIRKTQPFLETLSGEIVVFPGHGEPARLKDIYYN